MVSGNQLFYLIKGLLGLVAVLMVLYHTNQAWGYVTKHGTLGQRWRYIALLAWVTLVAGASLQQFQENAPVQSRNIGAVVVLVLTIVAMVISIHEVKGRKK